MKWQQKSIKLNRNMENKYNFTKNNGKIIVNNFRFRNRNKTNQFMNIRLHHNHIIKNLSMNQDKNCQLLPHLFNHKVDRDCKKMSTM